MRRRGQGKTNSDPGARTWAGAKVQLRTDFGRALLEATETEMSGRWPGDEARLKPAAIIFNDQLYETAAAV
jgi:hypothetical protein